MMMLLAQAAAAPAEPNEAYLLWGGILLAAAIGLLILEFLVPSGGVIGILCVIAAVGSAVSFFKYDSTLGIAMAVLYIIGTPILLFFLFKVWINSPLAKRMILTSGVTEPDQTDDIENEEAPETNAMQRKSRYDQMRELIGATGTAETALRPVGKVRIEGQRIDAMAESGVIEQGTPIVVTDVYDNQIKVRAAQP